MQALAKLCVQRPVLASVIILTLVIVGLFSIPKLGADLYPNVDIPWIIVTTRLPGASPEEMESQVTNEVEKQVNTISGIESLYSSSAEGMSIVSIGFSLEKDVDVAAQEVQSRVELATANLPTESEKPVVAKFNSQAAPILVLSLSSPNTTVRDITEYADKKIRPQLESIGGVGDVGIVGGRKRQVDILIDPVKLRAYDLTPIDIQRALGSENVQIPAGAMINDARRLSVRTQARAPRIADLEAIVVKNRQGQPITIKDVAKVTDSQEDEDTIADVNGKPAIVLQIKKQSGTNTVEVVDSVQERLKDVTKTLPAGYEIKVVTDRSIFIRAALESVREHLLAGALLASLVVLVFLRDWRSTLIASLAIPSSIIATFTLMYGAKLSLNVITLNALTLVVGIVIDDAIIVLENIRRFIDTKKMPPFQAAIEATREIGMAVMATTMSLVAVFAPIAFMTGIAGRFLHSFGATMSFAIMVSLVVAFTLTPTLSARLLKPVKENLPLTPYPPAPSRGDSQAPSPFQGEGRGEVTNAGHAAESGGGFSDLHQEEGFLGKMTGPYERILRWSLAHKPVIVIITLLMFLSTIPLVMIVNKNFMPEDDQSEFLVSVRAPEGTSVRGAQEILDSIATEIRKLPEVRQTVVTIGDDQEVTPNKGTITVSMNQVEDRKIDVKQQTLMQRVRNEIIPKYPRDLRVTVTPRSDFGDAESQITFVVSGPDLDTLIKTSKTIVTDVRKMPEVADVDTNAIEGKPELKVEVNRRIASDLGVSTVDIARSMRILLAGEKVSDFDEDGQHYDIRLRAEPGSRNNQELLALFNVPSYRDNHESVPISQVTDYRLGTGPSVVHRYARGREVTISVNLKPGQSEQAAQDKMMEVFNAQKLGAQYRAEFVGQSRELARSFQAFALAFLLSLIFMYLVLSAQFESFLHPITIMMSLPLTVPFALISLIILGQSLNVLSMLGLLVLFGVVKKNAILQVDHANQLRNHGLPRDEAIVTASIHRLRPILMTTIAFVAGMLPMALARGTGAEGSHASSSIIIGGQTLVLALTLIATPVFYAVMDDITNVIQRGYRKVVKVDQEESTKQDERETALV